jgi:hypothetical protein
VHVNYRQPRIWRSYGLTFCAANEILLTCRYSTPSTSHSAQPTSHCVHADRNRALGERHRCASDGHSFPPAYGYRTSHRKRSASEMMVSRSAAYRHVRGWREFPLGARGRGGIRQTHQPGSLTASQPTPLRNPPAPGRTSTRRRIELFGFEAGIEAKAPARLIYFDRYAGALTDRADTNVIIVEAPAFAVRIVVAAARERRHRS